MTQIDVQYITKETLEEFKKELIRLKKEDMPKLARKIDEARQMGDLSENAEYHSAREDMAWAMTRVKELEAVIDNAEIISRKAGTDGIIRVGSTVKLTVNDKERVYIIVGAHDADPLEGRISNESPIGKALLGEKVGSIVEVKIPAGIQKYTVISVE